MVSNDQFQALALGFTEATASPHFHKTSFRVRNKIFATLDHSKNEAVVKLSLEDQDVYCSSPNGAIKPVSGAWGRKGWTNVELGLVEQPLVKALITSAFIITAPKKLGSLYS